MKVSINWIKEFTDVELTVGQLVEKIGSQLGAVEEVIDLGTRYKGIVVAQVMSVTPHPNADKLYVCEINDGQVVSGVSRNARNFVQVVCGAPNVRENLMVAWLPPGSIVPSTYDKDPLKLEARDIRGVVSNGMLASGRELAINEDHEGIMEIDEIVGPGSSFAEVYKLNDYVIDIENKMFTHRPDCFGILGVAREIAGIQNVQFVSPEWYTGGLNLGQVPDESIERVEVDNRVPDLCPRYMATVVSGVQVRPSPIMIQTYLKRLGIRPINNIVDMTNFVMLLTAQPLHAFDFDKVSQNGKAKIIVRTPKHGEKITLLDGKIIEPRKDAVLICNPDKALALGGIMGGADTEIDSDTTRIIIECANFDLYNIRRTSMEHGLFTDSATRFTKNQSSWQCASIIKKAIQLTQELNPGANFTGDIADFHQPKQKPESVHVEPEFINARLGFNLSSEQISNTLMNVEFSAEISETLVGLNIKPPFWRTDISIAEDIVEEVGRLIGFDKLPLELPVRDLSPAKKDELQQLKLKVRDVLSRAGANEVLTYSFVHGNLLDKVGQNRDDAFQIANAISPELQYYRLSLTPSLLEKIHPNIKAGYSEFALFEIGKTHIKGEYTQNEPNVPAEFQRVALVFASDSKTAQKYGGAAYYQARKYLNQLLSVFGIADKVKLLPMDAAAYKGSTQTKVPMYDTGRSATILLGDVVLGEIGEYKAKVRSSLKLPDFCAGFELDLRVLLGVSGVNYVALPKYPKVEQDISLKSSATVTFIELYEYLQLQVESLKPVETLASLTPIDIYRRDNDPENRQVTFRLVIASYERTMTAEEVNTLLDKVAAAANEKFGAERL